MPPRPLEQVHLDTVNAEHRTGANVLCLHGMFAGGWVFEDLLPMIAARGYNASAISFRGHPPNPPLTGGIGGVKVTDYAREAGIAARILDRPIVIGHSLGGLIALLLAGRNLIRAAVLVSPAPARGISIMSPSILLRMANHLPSLVLSRPLLPRDSDFNALVLNKVPERDREAIRRRFVADSGAAARQVAIGSYRVPPRAMRVPLLVVGSDEDRFIPMSVAQKVAKKYDGTFHMARNHGHFLFAEPNWQQEAQVMLDWIDALPRVIRDVSGDLLPKGLKEPLGIQGDW